MKVLMALGSPRKNGNSETLARIVAETLEQNLSADVEYLRLAKADVSPCVGCRGCEKTGLCVFKDDMVEIYEKVDAAEIIILVSPIYFYGPSAQIKTFIDRFQARWSRKYLLKERFRQGHKRRGYLISAAATRGKKLFDGSIMIAKSYFDAVDVAYGGELVVRGVDERGDLQKKADELERAKQFATEIAEEFNK